MSKRREVAELAGVSEATVSRVMNNVGPIKEETRKKVAEAAEALNYKLDTIASSFARGKSCNLGVVLPKLPKVSLFSTYYFSEILSGIGEAVQGAGYGLLLLYRNPTNPFDYASLLQQRRVDACLVLGASDLGAEEEGLKHAADRGLPICLVDHEPVDFRISVVGTDHEQGSHTAVHHLISHGCRRIGFLNGAPHYSGSRARLHGYKRAIDELNVPFEPKLLWEGNYSRSSGYRLAAAVLDRMADLDGMFIANDRMALGLMQGLRELGMRLPEDLPMVGYDDSDVASIAEPALTTMRVPFFEMGYQAAREMLQRFNGWDAEASVFQYKLPTELIIRKSCGFHSQ